MLDIVSVEEPGSDDAVVSAERSWEPRIWLLAENEIIEPQEIDGNVHRFRLEAVQTPMRIRSLTCKPYLELGIGDGRTLGVAVKTISLVSAGLTLVIDHRSPLLTNGFYPAEPFHRWTNGDALLPLSLLEFAAAGGSAVVEIETIPIVTYAAQRLDIVGPVRGPCLTSADDHFEGVAYSSDGQTMAVAAAHAAAVFLYRRGPDGRFATTPVRRLGGLGTDFVFVHDLEFTRHGGRELLAALERRGRVSLWSVEMGPDRHADTFLGHVSIDAVEHLRLPESSSCHTDGLAFLPGERLHLAICEFSTNRVLFYRLDVSDTFAAQLVAVFECPHVEGAEGVVFSACGSLLAVTSHENHSVVIFARTDDGADEAPSFGPEPVAVIDHSCLRHPHSALFLPGTNDLMVTNSGAPDVHVFACADDGDGPRWSASPTTTFGFTPADVFAHRQRQGGGAAEGGAKGIAMFEDELALCSPEMGVQVFRIR